MRNMALAGVTLLIAAILAIIFFVDSMPVASTTTASPAMTQRELSQADTERFIEIVNQDDLPAARSMLEQWPKLVEARAIRRGELALHHAQSVAMAQLLVEHGADPAARDRETKGTPARWAASNWHPDVVRFLETKAPPEQDIAYLVATGRTDRISQALVKAPEQLDVRTAPEDVLGGGRHLLHIASTYGQPAVVELLLKSGADASVDGGWNNVGPLENAAWAGYPDIVKLLVKSGADLEAPDSQGNHTPLWYAAVTGRTEVVKILLDAGAKIEDGMITAVQDSKRSPYPGRALPEKQQYDAVIALLLQHGGK